MLAVAGRACAANRVGRTVDGAEGGDAGGDAIRDAIRDAGGSFGVIRLVGLQVGRSGGVAARRVLAPGPRRANLVPLSSAAS